MKVKTLVSRISDADKMDVEIEKFAESVKESGMELKDIKTACGEYYIVTQFFLEEKKASGSRRSSKA